MIRLTHDPGIDSTVEIGSGALDAAVAGQTRGRRFWRLGWLHGAARALRVRVGKKSRERAYDVMIPGTAQHIGDAGGDLRIQRLAR